MAIIGILSLLVCLIGLIVYLALTGFSKASFAEAARIAFFGGLLAFLMSAGAQSCSIGSSSSSSASHK